MNGEELFLSNLDVIERASRFIAGRARLSPEDADDLVASVKLRLLEDDYGVLRKFEGRCSLSTYVASIAHRLFANEWMHTHGRWRPSAEAKRLGEAAILLEGLLLRDRLSLEEALPIVQRIDETVTIEIAASIMSRLPQRTPRPRLVALDDVAEPSMSPDSVEARAIAHDTSTASDTVSRVVRDTLDSMSAEDRVVLRLRYENSMRVADIARALDRDQKQLYRRLDAIVRLLREQLARAGVDAAVAANLIGGADSGLEFGLHDAENKGSRQAMGKREHANTKVP